MMVTVAVRRAFMHLLYISPALYGLLYRLPVYLLAVCYTYCKHKSNYKQKSFHNPCFMHGIFQTLCQKKIWLPINRFLTNKLRKILFRFSPALYTRRPAEDSPVRNRNNMSVYSCWYKYVYGK